MSWIKNILIDLSVTVLVVLATLFDQVWAGWIVIVYTPIMLLLKFGAFFGGSFLPQFRRSEAEVPSWVYHALYAVNVALLLMLDWWGTLAIAWATALEWVLIWGLSVGAEMKMRTTSDK